MKSICMTVLFCFMSTQAFGQSSTSLDGYWVSAQLSYAMKTTNAKDFCAGLKYKEHNVRVTSFPSVILIEKNSYSICSLTDGPSWKSSCDLSAQIENGLLKVGHFQTQFVLTGTNLMEVESVLLNGKRKEVNAGNSLFVRVSESALNSVSQAAKDCNLMN